MVNNTENNIRILEASSPEELNSTLKSLPLNDGTGPRSVVLSIRGPKVMVCPFHLTKVPMKDVRHHLLGEAVELMSLTSDDIELDFQVTDSNEENIKGIYICSPRRVVEDYLLALEDSQLRPVVVTEHFLTRINTLYRQEKIGKGRVAFLSFLTGKTIDLFVANDREHELIRRIPFETFEEAQREIVQSLRSACAKSWPKHYDVIYYAGNIENIDELQATMKKAFNVDLEQCSAKQPVEGDLSGTDYFTVNLLKKYIFFPQQLEKIRMGVNIVLAACLLAFVVLNVRIVMRNKTIDEMRAGFQTSEYQYALDLKKNIK